MNIRDPHTKVGSGLEVLFERHEHAARRPLPRSEAAGARVGAASGGVQSLDQAPSGGDSAQFAGLMSAIASELHLSADGTQGPQREDATEATEALPDLPEQAEGARPGLPPNARDAKRSRQGHPSEALLDKIFDAVNSALSQLNVAPTTTATTTAAAATDAAVTESSAT